MLGLLPTAKAMLLTSMLWAFSVTVVAQTPPNIVMLIIDDLGWNDHGIHLPSDIPTANLNALAKDGIVLTNYYTQTVCSPTRSSLISGRFPFRMGMQHQTTLLPGTEAHLPQDTPTLAESLRDAGYVTAAVGKWHLGYAKFDYTPTGRGFNSHVGYLQGRVDYFNKTIGNGYDFWSNQTVLRGDAEGNYSLDSYVTEYHRALTVHKQSGSSAPFFLYLAHQTVHNPLEAAREAGESRCDHINDHWRHVFCSMLVELDDSIGDLVTLLKDYDYWNNTIVLATTDNGGMTDWNEDSTGKPAGPASIGCNYPLRGGKTTMFEGGVRGTAFIAGGLLPDAVRGTRWNALMHAVDLPTTALGLANVTLPADVDGLDFSESVLDTTATPPTQEHTFIPINVIENATTYTAIRFGKHFKLIVGNSTMQAAADGYWTAGNHTPTPPPPSSGVAGALLFNVTADPTELRDLAAQHPELVQLGKDLLAQIVTSGNYQEPQPNLPHPLALPVLHDGVWAPFLKGF